MTVSLIMSFNYMCMEEKKKRWRPSLGDYRSLEREIEGHMEDKSRLVAECDAWREKYRALVKEVSRLRSRGLWERLFNK